MLAYAARLAADPIGLIGRAEQYVRRCPFGHRLVPSSGEKLAASELSKVRPAARTDQSRPEGAPAA
jgi:hypothetical protein